jgi:KDO2-lipid IV(A) lauroyltransferase
MAGRKKKRRRNGPVVKFFNALLGNLAAGILRLLRRLNREKLANWIGPVSRRVGPFLPEHRTGRANLRAAFPEKSADEIEAILGGVWDNLGRFVADFAHLDRLRIYDPEAPGPHEIEFNDETAKRFIALRESGKPALIFAAHLANWELPPLVAHRYGIETTVLYRRPNLPGIADAVVAMRASCMGTLLPARMDAPLKLANALQRGEAAGMLVDQHDNRGVIINFFGREVQTSALLARLARQIECPIHGVRVVRLPDNRFRVDLTDPIEPVRDAEGHVDVEATMQAVTDVIEGWIREYPEQWLWVHRRWRPLAPAARLKSRSGTRPLSSR